MSKLLLIVYILLIIILIRNVDSAELNNVIGIKKLHVNIPLNIAFLHSKHHSLRNFVSNKNDVSNRGLLMENLHKRSQRDVSKQCSTVDPTLNQLKQVLSKFLFSKDKLLKKREINTSPGQQMKYTKSEHYNRKKFEDSHTWYNWTNWSTCSVTCGKGREIRWRHCKENCKNVETEMEEKACQLPACPEKLFGIIKL